MHPYFAMLVPVLYTLIQSNRPQTKSKFQIVSKIFRNPGKLTLCWLTKKFDNAYCIRSRAGQHRKKKKQLRFLYLYLLEEIDGPTNLEFQIVSKIFRNPGNMTLCWLKKNRRRVSHQWDYSRTTQKKKKQLHFLYLLEKIDWPCTPQFNQTD